MNLEDEITRSLAARAERTAYDATPLASVEHTARGIRRRQRSLMTVAAAVAVAAIVVPVAALTMRDHGGDGTIGPADPPTASSTPAPSPTLGYLADGTFYREGADPLDVPVEDVTRIRGDGAGGVWVLHGAEAGLLSSLAHVTAGGVEDLGCAVSLPVVSPDLATVAVATRECGGGGGKPWTVEISGGGSATTTVAGTPYLQGVGDDGTVVYYDYVPNKTWALAAEPGAEPRLVSSGAFTVYDAPRGLLLGGMGGAGTATSGIGGLGGTSAFTLEGLVAWTSDSTHAVIDVSPDGSRILGQASTANGDLSFPVIRASDGGLEASLPVSTGRDAITALAWYDDTHVLGTTGPDRNPGYVLIGLDGDVVQMPLQADTLVESR